MATKARNYVRERKTESRARKEARKARGRARYAAIKAGKVKKGDGKVVGHKKAISSGGSNSKSNIRIESSKRSSKEGGRGTHKGRAGKAAGGRASRSKRK